MLVVKILLFALSLAAGITAWQISLISDSNGTNVPELQTLELKVLSADGRQTIGSTRFTVSSDRSSETIKGETRYLDGQHDNERGADSVGERRTQTRKVRAFVLRCRRYNYHG